MSWLFEMSGIWISWKASHLLWTGFRRVDKALIWKSMISKPKQFPIKSIKFRVFVHNVKNTHMQCPFRLAFSWTNHEGERHTLKKLKLGLFWIFRSCGQLYVALSCVNECTYLLLLHKQSDTPRTASEAHNMPVTVVNHVWRETVRLLPQFSGNSP